MNQSTSREASDYVVIGAGLAGSATAWKLAQRGHDVTLLERTTPANAQGSSHGSARIFRYAYPEKLYANLVKQARTGWDELEALAGSPLINPVGAVDYGPTRDPRNLANVLEQVGVEHELMGAADARERFAGIAFDTEVLWQPGAGVIDAEESVLAMVSQVVKHGARVENNWPVARIEATASGYRIFCADGRTHDCSKVIVAAGGWLPELLGNLSLPAGFVSGIPSFEVFQEQAFHFPYADASAESMGIWPTYIHKAGDFQSYGLPGGRDADFRGQKVAEYKGGRVMRGASEQDGLVSAANRERIIDYVKTFLPGLVPEPYAETTCLFTMTPNEDFILDETNGITIMSPCSGHGAKFAPLLGELAADLATGAAGVPEIFRPGSKAQGLLV
jgi:sarcosine oxidase